MSQNSAKLRLDRLLVERKLISTRTRAREMILSGFVLVQGKIITRPGESFEPDTQIEITQPESKYVSRGAVKLKGAIEKFKPGLQGVTAIDVGASTGGFTEVLLEEGASRVYAIDVGSSQLSPKLKNDPRVINRENYNARSFSPEDFPERFNLLVMDVSFISIKLLIPKLIPGLLPQAELIVLFKPQFEVGKQGVGAGGIVKDQSLALAKLEETLKWADALGLKNGQVMESPILGADGNHEYLIYWKQG